MVDPVIGLSVDWAQIAKAGAASSPVVISAFLWLDNRSLKKVIDAKDKLAAEDRQYERDRSEAQQTTLLKINDTMRGLESAFIALKEVLK